LTTTAKAHGLDGAPVEPDWPPLTLSEVRILLENFPTAAAPVAILSTSPRPFSAASVVETLRGRVFIKRHARVVRDAEGLAEEHRFMQHLRANGIGIPRVLETVSGDTAVESGDWTYEVHEIPGGVDLYEDAISWTPFTSAEHARSAGEMLARMHMAAEQYNAPARKIRPLVASFTVFASQHPGTALEQYLNARPALDHDAATRRDCAQGLELLAPFHDELKTLLPSLPFLWTQNDLHASNLFWSDAGPHAHATSVIDFGLADRTNAVYDIAQALERSIVEWLELVRDPDAGDRVPVHIDLLCALLAGYESVRPLSSAEATALAPMLALGHAEFALTEAHYFLEVLHSPEKARIATHDYLVKHAQWFRGAGSQKLLDPLRRWAESSTRQVVRA
jgi:Ser/Thr protein kinase RdoA (MazF antagonist)